MMSLIAPLPRDGRRAFLFLLAAIVVTSVHHIYRLGPAFLPTALVAVLVPPLLVAWYWHTGHPFILRILGAYSIFVFVSVGVFDGFLDHTLKALGLPRFYMLEGSEAEIVATYFNFASVELGHLFYEATGILTFVLGAVATFYSIRLLLRPRPVALT